MFVYVCNKLGEIVSQQAMVEDTTGQSDVLTTYCLTEDDSF